MPPANGVQFSYYLRDIYQGPVMYNRLNKWSGVYYLSGSGPDLDFFR